MIHLYLVKAHKDENISIYVVLLDYHFLFLEESSSSMPSNLRIPQAVPTIGQWRGPSARLSPHPLHTSLCLRNSAIAHVSMAARMFSPDWVTSWGSYQLLHRLRGRAPLRYWTKGSPCCSVLVSAFGIRCESTKVPSVRVSLQTPVCLFLLCDLPIVQWGWCYQARTQLNHNKKPDVS